MRVRGRAAAIDGDDDMIGIECSGSSNLD